MSLEFIEEVTQNAVTVQKNVLAEILGKNANTEYLRPFNIDGASDPTTIFKSKIPMICYDDIHPFIRRIADGDRSPILTADPISLLYLSSGTSSGGEGKLIPFSEEELDRVLFISSLFMPIIKRHVKDVEKGKGLCFFFTMAEIKSKDGLRVETMSSSCYKRLASTPNLENMYTSPKEAILCTDVFQSKYTQMLCGLYQRQHVTWLGSAFASGLIRVINFLRLNWSQLARDIQTGTLNPQVSDVSIRECMTPVLHSDPELAAFIAQECGKDNWEGIIARIWPNAKYLETTITGTMTQYIPALDYYSGGLPKLSMDYGCSECYAAINLDPMCDPSEIAYTIMPNMAYFEFLPHAHGFDSSKEQLVDLADVEVGKEYELVLTTRVGLYRYRVGDILRVAGFHNLAPKFEFVGRQNVLLSIDTDKTDEVRLQAAVANAGRLLHKFETSVVEYTSFADTKSSPGHYVIYLELLVKERANSPGDEVLHKCCLAMEESFDDEYLYLRVLEKDVIGPLEIRVVKNGTFEEVMEHAISKGASITQYKMARCVKSKPIMDLLDLRVVSNHFSPSLPNWTPKPYIKE